MLLTVLGIIFRLIGMAECFERWRSARQNRQQAQREADTPLNVKELQDAQRRGDF
ncbi:MAG TPA: hypothetical protein VFE62_24170 [Gemmataceae bacterium]|nr:hypothetical protein [Gemmataceae bacterium]